MAEKNTRTRSYGMMEKCAECQNYWLDGHKDCQITSCGLYPWMPYRKLEPDWSWSTYSPKRTGRVTWEESKKDMSPEQEEAAKERGRQLGASRRETMVNDGVDPPVGEFDEEMPSEYGDCGRRFQPRVPTPSEGFQPQVPTPPEAYADTAGPEDTEVINPESYNEDPIWG